MADEAGETADSLRSACIRRLAAWLSSIERDHAVRVAVDGPDAAGKTTLACEVAAYLADVHRRPAICVSLDGFHLDQRRRHRRGRPSPEGYIDDSFDYASLKRVVLDPLRPGATMGFRHVVFDFRTDAPVAGPRWASHNPDRSTRCDHTQSFTRPVFWRPPGPRKAWHTVCRYKYAPSGA